MRDLILEDEEIPQKNTYQKISLSVGKSAVAVLGELFPTPPGTKALRRPGVAERAKA